MSLSPGGTPVSTSAPPQAIDPSFPVILRMRRGAGWFLTIAILSGVNSVLQIFEAKIRFMFGLGVTQLVDGMARGMGQSGTNCSRRCRRPLCRHADPLLPLGKDGFAGGLSRRNDCLRPRWRFALALQHVAGCGCTCLRTVDDLARLYRVARAGPDATSSAAGLSQPRLP